MYCMQLLGYNVCKFIIVPIRSSHILSLAYCIQRTQTIKIRPLYQNVAKKRLKTIEKSKTATVKSDHGRFACERRSFTRVSNYKALTGKFWCFG